MGNFKTKAKIKGRSTIDNIANKIMDKKARGTCTAISEAAVKEMAYLTRLYSGSMSDNRLMSISINGVKKRAKTYTNSGQLQKSVTRSNTQRVGNKYVSYIYYDSDKIDSVSSGRGVMKPYYSVFKKTKIDPSRVISWIEEGQDYTFKTKRGMRISVKRRPSPVRAETTSYIRKILKTSSFRKRIDIGFGKTYSGDDNVYENNL